MTLLNKTPQARKEALAYCHRCLAVMLCCVLVFGLTVRTAPRAKAVVVADDIAILGLFGLSSAASSFAQHPVEGSLGQYIITGSGVKIKSGTVLDDLSGKTYFDAKVQELGVELVTYLAQQTGEVAEWIGSTVTGYQAQGGLAPGDSFEMPAAVVAAARQWLQTALAAGADDNGVTSFHSRLILGPNGPFLLTEVDTTTLDAYTSNSSRGFWLPVSNLGTCFGFPSIDFSASCDTSFSLGSGIVIITKYVLGENRRSASLSMYTNFLSGKLVSSGAVGAGCNGISLGSQSSYEVMVSKLTDYVNSSDPSILFYSYAKSRIYVGQYLSNNNTVAVLSDRYYSLTEDQAPAAVATTMTKTDAVDETPVAPITVTVPADLPVAQVGDYTAPMAAELTPDVVTGAQDPATPTAAPVPGTGITAQDIAGAIGQAVPGAVADGIAQALPDAIAQALPITGAIATDQAVNEVAQDPESLGSVFISKFPFSIPWDVGKVISLLAAQPVTPHWEVDFYAPLEGVGGFHAQGSTNFVIDFENLSLVGQLCRWTSTLGFIYSLMLATKRLIWTA